MKDIRLHNLNLRNFKGCEKLSWAFDGNNASILGDNATGKSTLMDAFLWLLHGKDSLGKADFEIKPTGLQGAPERGIECEVSASFDVSGDRLVLKKVMAETWTKKRGQATAEFTGHSVSYWVDDVPVKKREYDSKVAEIADDTLFRLLTNPRHFSESMHWQDRRKLLLAVCGDITDAEVIASDPALSALPEILGKRSLDDHRKVIAARRTEINKQLADIPVRIDEIKRGAVYSEFDEKSVNSQIAVLSGQKRDKETELIRLQTGGEIAEKTKALSEIDGKIVKISNLQVTAHNDLLRAKQKEIDEAERKVWKIESATKELREAVQKRALRIAENEAHMGRLRIEWKAVSADKYAGEDLCPTCGQLLPEEKREPALASWNEAQARKLTNIRSKAKALEADNAEFARASATDEKRLAELDQDGAVVKQRIVDLKATMASPPALTSPEIAALQVEREDIERAISELREGSHDAEAEVRAEITRLEADITERRNLLAAVKRAQADKERVDELMRQERSLAAEFERLEGELYLTEQFMRAKVSMLEGRINDRFRIAKFKLFDVAINQGLTETCEITVNGVPYGSLNSAARIQAGMDVIRTLSEHYGISICCWIDNRESVVKLPEMECQVISLVVSANHKTLTIGE